MVLYLSAVLISVKHLTFVSDPVNSYSVMRFHFSSNPCFPHMASLGNPTQPYGNSVSIQYFIALPASLLSCILILLISRAFSFSALVSLSIEDKLDLGYTCIACRRCLNMLLIHNYLYTL